MEKWNIFSRKKKIRQINYVFSKFFSKIVTFTKFLPKRINFRNFHTVNSAEKSVVKSHRFCHSHAKLLINFLTSQSKSNQEFVRKFDSEHGITVLKISKALYVS